MRQIRTLRARRRGLETGSDGPPPQSSTLPGERSGGESIPAAIVGTPGGVAAGAKGRACSQLTPGWKDGRIWRSLDGFDGLKSCAPGRDRHSGRSEVLGRGILRPSVTGEGRLTPPVNTSRRGGVPCDLPVWFWGFL